MEMPRTVGDGQDTILVAWAASVVLGRAHQKCQGSAHLVLIDADDSSFKTGRSAFFEDTPLTAWVALPCLAEQRMRGLNTLTNQLDTTELVILLTDSVEALGRGLSRVRSPGPTIRPSCWRWPHSSNSRLHGWTSPWKV